MSFCGSICDTSSQSLLCDFPSLIASAETEVQLSWNLALLWPFIALTLYFNSFFSDFILIANYVFIFKFLVRFLRIITFSCLTYYRLMENLKAFKFAGNLLINQLWDLRICVFHPFHHFRPIWYNIKELLTSEALELEKVELRGMLF